MDILILLLVITFLVLAPAIINKKIKRPFPIECPNCKYSGIAKYLTKGSFLMEVILWCFLIILWFNLFNLEAYNSEMGMSSMQL